MGITYDFDVVFVQNKIESLYTDVTKSIYVSDICIVAKNQKVGGLYFSKYVDEKIGKFQHVAGSWNYPILYVSGGKVGDKVMLRVKDFPKKPIFKTDKNVSIIIKNIKINE
jgi:hypothetical protein